MAKPVGKSATIYPRPKTRTLLARAAKEQKMTLSQFLITTALRAIAKSKKAKVEDLIPAAEFEAHFNRSWTRRT